MSQAHESDAKPKKPGFRIVSRSYTDDPGPMVEVLLLLHAWSVDRQQRQAEERRRTVNRDAETPSLDVPSPL